MTIIALNVGHGDVAGVTAPGLEIIATGAKVAAVRAFVGQGKVAWDRHKRARCLVGAGQGDRAEEGLCIGMTHLVEHVFDRTAFDRFAGIHHTQPVTGFQNKAKVVRDEQHRRAVFHAEFLDQFDDRGFDGHVQGGCWFIKDQQRWFGHQGHGDDDALLLTTGELMGKGVQDPLGVRQFDIGDNLKGAVVGLFFGDAFVDHRDFHQLFADAHGRVQRGHGFLIDHRDFIAADLAQVFGGHGRQVAALEFD